MMNTVIGALLLIVFGAIAWIVLGYGTRKIYPGTGGSNANNKNGEETKDSGTVE